MLLRSVILAASLLIPSPVAPATIGEAICSAPVAVPATVTTPNATYYSDKLPPQRFRSNGRVLVRFADQRTIDRECGKAPCNMVTLGCLQSSVIMILPNPCSYGPDDDYAVLVCHELGHLNGWPATHGD